jgi:hypothetical protein
MVCEQLGEEPDPSKMPLELSDFPQEVQEAFFVYSLLSDHWDGASGSYMGKFWTEIDYILKLYEIEDKKTVYSFAKRIEAKVVVNRANKAAHERKAAERRAKGAGKNFTHNVRG